MAETCHDEDDVQQQDLLWLLSDSNLPTGGFVASSGLEAYFVHGFLHRAAEKVASSSSRSSPAGQRTSTDRIAAATVEYVAASLTSYASSAVPFLLDAHWIVSTHLNKLDPIDQASQQSIDNCIRSLARIDEAYHSFALNHVVRRASKAQGMALLALYSKSFAQAPLHEGTDHPGLSQSQSRYRQASRSVIEEFRRRVRSATSSNAAPHAHLPICWGILTAALGISASQATSLHLFLQARAMISSSVRLNTVGPYLAHGLLMYEVRKVVKDVLRQCPWHAVATTGLTPSSDAVASTQHSRGEASGVKVRTDHFARDWDWKDEGAAWEQEEKQPRGRFHDDMGTSYVKAPVNNWPLGEIIQGRHDVLHSRLFNS